MTDKKAYHFLHYHAFELFESHQEENDTLSVPNDADCLTHLFENNNILQPCNYMKYITQLLSIATASSSYILPQLLCTHL